MLTPVFEPAGRFTGSAFMREGNFLLVGPFRASRRFDHRYTAPAPTDDTLPSRALAGNEVTYLLVHVTR